MFKSLLHKNAVRSVAVALVAALGLSVAGGALLAAPANAATTPWAVYDAPTCDPGGFAAAYIAMGVPGGACDFAYMGVTQWDPRYPTLYMDTTMYVYGPSTNNTLKMTYTYRYKVTCAPTGFWCGNDTTWIDPATGSAGGGGATGTIFHAPQFTPTANTFHVLETKVWRFYGGAWQSATVDGIVDPTGQVVQVTHT
jgi:hypothetical protein